MIVGPRRPNVDELKFNITRRVKLATISWGWTYSEGNREKRGIRVHEECQAGTQWSPVGRPSLPRQPSRPEWLDGEKSREDPEAGQERGLRGGGKQSTLNPEQLARAPMRPGAGRS